MTNANPTTLRSLAGLPNESPAIADATIVVVDAQNEYLPSGRLALPGIGVAADNIASILSAARHAGSPVIHIAHQGQPGTLFDPDGGGRIIDAAAPAAGEPVVMKSLPNSFVGTGLGPMLDEMHERPIVIVGFMTHMCVSATARAALDLGFATVVVSDASATRALPSATGRDAVSARAVHEASLAALADRFSVVVTTDDLLRCAS